mmetsp:Transcript_6336/g.7277  ORF Transcript_6336/g.7277 Transcript_6336/m.7277 type:complete len:250 (-) Transcript_6336:74-823(-)
MKPGLFSCPAARPFVRIEVIKTNFGTFAMTAASTRFTVPTLSTACAACLNFSGFPGTNPIVQITLPTPSSALAVVAGSSVTSNCLNSTPSTFSPSFSALATLRTPAMHGMPCFTSSLTTSCPVSPVAPATNTGSELAANATLRNVSGSVASTVNPAMTAAMPSDSWPSVPLRVLTRPSFSFGRLSAVTLTADLRLKVVLQVAFPELILRGLGARGCSRCPSAQRLLWTAVRGAVKLIERELILVEVCWE